MENEVDRVIGFMMSVVSAVFVPVSLAYIAHYDFDLSREEVRGAAMVGAGVIAASVAIEFFGKKLRKLK